MSSANQHTLAGPATLVGTSLHTGEKVSLTLKPAPEGHGFKFRRIDLPDQPFISADVEKVQTVERATTLAEGSVKVHTVEHVISALTGMGVDNALIEMDANEPPIGDGSSRPFVEMIRKVGLLAQNASRRVWEIRETIYQETADGSILTIIPCKTFRVSVTNVGPEGRFTQYYSTEVTPAVYEKEICAARTFVYYEDVKPLLEKGLIKGGSDGEGVLDINEVMRILPHRYPFLMVDRIVECAGDSRCVGVKNVTINEPYFSGHFPGHPIMPGVMQLEAMAQVSSVLMLRRPENTGKLGYFMSADNVKWRRPVLPGDTLFIETDVLKVRGSIGQTRCRCLVNGEVVSEAELKFLLLDR